MKKAIPFIILAVCVIIVITASIVQFVALDPNTPTQGNDTPTVESTPNETPTEPDAPAKSIMPDGCYFYIAGNMFPDTIYAENFATLIEFIYPAVSFDKGVVTSYPTLWEDEYIELDGKITIPTHAIWVNLGFEQEDTVQATYDPETQILCITNGEKTGYYKAFENQLAYAQWLAGYIVGLEDHSLPESPSWYETFNPEDVPHQGENPPTTEDIDPTEPNN